MCTGLLKGAESDREAQISVRRLEVSSSWARLVESAEARAAATLAAAVGNAQGVGS